MMRLIFALLVVSALALAQQVQIKAQRFEADQQAMVTKFFGGVVFRQGEDRIESNRAFIYFNKAKKPIKFVVEGDVRFHLVKEGKIYDGSCQKLIYYPLKKEYILQGDVRITQRPEGRKIFAQRVVLDLRNGNLKVEGGKKEPVKLIFKIEEK